VIAIDARARRELPAGFVEGLEALGCSTLRDFPDEPARVGVRVLRPPPR
jgi:hypothetical protein